MHRSIDTIAGQCSQYDHVMLTEDETGMYIPELHNKITERKHRSNSSASFSVVQDGYSIDARVTYLNGTYRAIIHNMTKQDEHQKVSVPSPHRRRSA